MTTKTLTQRRLTRRLSALDAFPKIEAQLQEATPSGGLVSLLMLALLAYLAAAELVRWRAGAQRYEFLVDQSRSHQHGLQINVDLTIAMNCKYLRADVLDIAMTSLPVKDALHASPVYFDTEGTLSIQDHLQIHDENKVDVHNILREKNRQLQQVRSKQRSGEKDACRFSGTFSVNKVEGMLHFTALGHGYYGAHTPHDAINFTHRIDGLSFGLHYPGLWNPLDHTFEMGKSHFDNFMYFIGVVPTIYVDNARTFFGSALLTNQYAVTEFFHSVDTEKPDTLPGIFIKYNIEPISVRITEQRQNVLHFLTRICGIIGGAYVTIGAILSVFQNISTLMRKSQYIRLD